MTAAPTSPPTIISGHCGIRRHGQCVGRYAGFDCRCECHTAPPVVTAHCFYACGHVEEGTDPRAVHEAMEAHYRARHTPAPVRHCATCSCPWPPHSPHLPRSRGASLRSPCD